MNPIERIEKALSEMEAREKAATPGEWKYCAIQPWDDKFALTVNYPADIGNLLSESDAKFLAHARTDIPALIAALRHALKHRSYFNAAEDIKLETIANALEVREGEK
jgi:hypothetical protein